MNLIELIEEIAPESKCQLCKHDKWTIWFDDESTDNPTSSQIHGQGYYSLSCDNCGNTLFLKKTIVDKKLSGVE